MQFLSYSSKLIDIKGSKYHKVKKCENSLLQQTMLRKIKENYELQNEQRKLLWLQFTQIYEHQNLYSNLAELQLPPDTECLIQKDVVRTYYTKQLEDQSQKQSHTISLRNEIKQSLSRFALYNPYLLYCQGMNQIFAFFHEEGFSSKEIFFLFKRITEVLLPCDYYSSLEGVATYLKILWEILSVQFPDIHKKLNHIIKQMDIKNSYLCVFSHFLQWFVCLFSNSSLNRQVRRTIMDYFLLQGMPALLKTSLAILQYLRPTILNVKSFESYVKNIQQVMEKFSDVSLLKKTLSNKFISKQILFLLKQYLQKPQQQTVKRKFAPYTKRCCRKWNYCLQKLQNDSQNQLKYDYFVFKRKENIKLIPEYLSKLDTYYFQQKKRSKPIDLAMIGRIPHICQPTSETCTEDSLSQTNTKKESPFLSRYSPSPAKQYVNQMKNSIKLGKSLKQTKERAQKMNFAQLNHPKLNQFNQTQENSYQDIDTVSQSMLNNDDSRKFRQERQFQKELLKQKLLQQAQKKSMQKSQSMMFMKMMVANESYSNLLSLLQMDKMFDIDSNSDEQDQSISGYSPTFSNKRIK